MEKINKVLYDNNSFSLIFNEKEYSFCKYLKELNKKIYIKPTSATIRIINGKIVITKEKNGYKLNEEELKNTIIRKIKDMYNKDEIIPTLSVKPFYSYKELSQINTV